MKIFSCIRCTLIITWFVFWLCIWLHINTLKYHTSKSLMDMSALPVAMNLPSRLKRAHLATLCITQNSPKGHGATLLHSYHYFRWVPSENAMKPHKKVEISHLMLWNMTCIMLWKNLWMTFWLRWADWIKSATTDSYATNNTSSRKIAVSRIQTFRFLCTWSPMSSLGE